MKKKSLDKVLIQDSFKLPPTVWQVNEAEENSKVDGQHILARVQGPMGLADGVSLNKRRYQPKLWENTIKNLESRFSNGGVPGTIGHDQPLDEKALIEGKISHLLTNLWIKENTVMGEILVLGTDSGRQLNTCLRAGMPIPVSSRAYGKISGQGEMGEDIIDPESFILESFDFVLNPGVDTAYPKVVENKSETEEDQMDKELQELMAKVEALTKVNEAATATTKTQEEVKKLTEENKKLWAAVNFYKAHVGLPKQVPAMESSLRKWLELEPFKSLAKETNLTNRDGSYTTADLVKQLTESFEKLTKFASPEKVAELEAKVAAHEAVGTVQEMETVLELLEQYAKAGKPSEIKARIKRAQKIESVLLEVRRKVASRKIGEKFNRNADGIYEMLKTMKTKDVIATLNKLTEAKSNDLSTYKVNESKGSKPALSIVKSLPTGKGVLGARLMGSLTKVGSSR